MKIVKQGVGVFRPKHKHQQQKQVQSQQDAGSPRGWVNVVAEGGTEKGVEVKVEEGEVKTEGMAVKEEEMEGKPKMDEEPESEAETERQPKRKALLIGIQNYDKVERLRGPHTDVLDMRQLLIDHYGYNPDDICVLMDRDDLAEDMKPTKDNIMIRMDELVEGARSGDRFFFHFAGHSTQQDTDNLLEEEDGKDEFIVTMNGELIQDNVLRERLVAPLPIGSSLVAVFDSCHSASLLDLEHFRCNRVYVPWMNKGRRRSNSRWNAIVRRQAVPVGPPTPLGPKTPVGSGSKNPVNAAAVNQGPRSPVRNVFPRSPVRTAPQSPAGSLPKSPLHATFKPSPLNPATSSPVTCTCICSCPPWVKQELGLEAGEQYAPLATPSEVSLDGGVASESLEASSSHGAVSSSSPEASSSSPSRNALSSSQDASTSSPSPIVFPSVRRDAAFSSSSSSPPTSPTTSQPHPYPDARPCRRPHPHAHTHHQNPQLQQQPQQHQNPQHPQTQAQQQIKPLLPQLDISTRKVFQTKRVSTRSVRWRRTSIDRILESPVVGPIGLAELGGSMGMESVAPSPTVASPALGPGEYGLGQITEWNGFVEDVNAAAHGTNTQGIKAAAAQLLYDPSQYNFNKISITTQSSTKVVPQPVEGAAGNKGKNKENVKPGGKSPLSSTSKKAVAQEGLKAQSLTIRTDVKASTSQVVGVRAGSEGAIVGGVVFPGGQQVLVGGNKARQGSLGAAAVSLEAAAAAGSSSRRSTESYHTTNGSSVPAANGFGLLEASEHWYGNLTGSPIQRCMSPEALFCTGFCHERWEMEKKANGGVLNHVDVISLSASKDGQRSWEDKDGSSMTQALIALLKEDPNPSLRDLLTNVSHELHRYYLRLHTMSRDYKKQIKERNARMAAKGRSDRITVPQEVEMDNFQDPQISSSRPLDVGRLWRL